jgi:hypothetical protein
MTIRFTTPQIRSMFAVGDRVRIDIFTLYKKPPYEFIEGMVYQVRVDFPLLSSTAKNFVYDFDQVKFRYGVQPDYKQFPRLKDLENEFYDLPEDYLIPLE